MAIMRVLWARGRATVGEVREALEPGRELAYSTVATMLAKMERKGVVRHTTDGRAFVYEPTVAEEQVSRWMAEELLDRLFDGSVASLMSHLLESRDFSADELERIKRLISGHEAARREAGRVAGAKQRGGRHGR